MTLTEALQDLYEILTPTPEPIPEPIPGPQFFDGIWHAYLKDSINKGVNQSPGKPTVRQYILVEDEKVTAYCWSSKSESDVSTPRLSENWHPIPPIDHECDYSKLSKWVLVTKLVS